MEGAVVLRSGTSMILWLYFRKLHQGLTLDDFEDVLDQELQQGEAVIHSVGLEWALLRVREWSLLESILPATLVVNGGVSML